jgi:hypothetical protein
MNPPLPTDHNVGEFDNFTRRDQQKPILIQVALESFAEPPFHDVLTSLTPA